MIMLTESNKLKKPVGYHQDLLVHVFISSRLFGRRLPLAGRGDGAQHQPREGQFGLRGRHPGGRLRKQLGVRRLQGAARDRFSDSRGDRRGFIIRAENARKDPKAALMGLFLYLGTSALKGNQMFARSTELLGGPLVDLDTLDASPKAKRRTGPGPPYRGT